MAERNRTPFYGAVPTSKLNANHIIMADGSTLQELADKKFELIEEITLTEDTAIIERTTEPDGTPYNFNDIYIAVYTPNTSTIAFNCSVVVNDQTNYKYYMYQIGAVGSARYSKFILSNYKGIFTSISNTAGTAQTNNTIFTTPLTRMAEPINKLTITGSANIKADSVFTIYAVRA